jgi:hypothetical protein
MIIAKDYSWAIITNTKCGTRSLEALVKQHKLGEVHIPLHRLEVPDDFRRRCDPDSTQVYFTIRDPMKRWFSIYKYHTHVLLNPWNLPDYTINTWAEKFFSEEAQHEDTSYIYWRWTHTLTRLYKRSGVWLHNCLKANDLVGLLFPGVELPHKNKSPVRDITDEELHALLFPHNVERLAQWCAEDYETFKEQL